MAKYRKKPVVIEAITFDELVKHGLENGANVNNGMPWSWNYNGHPITHENDQCYLIPTLEGTHNMTPADMLITGVKGEIYPCKRDIFEATYEKVETGRLDCIFTFDDRYQEEKTLHDQDISLFRSEDYFLSVILNDFAEEEKKHLVCVSCCLYSDEIQEDDLPSWYLDINGRFFFVNGKLYR